MSQDAHSDSEAQDHAAVSLSIMAAAVSQKKSNTPRRPTSLPTLPYRNFCSNQLLLIQLRPWY